MWVLKRDELVVQLHSPGRREMVFFFLSGAVISIPQTLFIEQYAGSLLVGLSSVWVFLVSGVFFAPFVEEFSKASPLFYRHGESERSIFKLGLLVGLGFGFSELLIYLFVGGAPLIGRLPAAFLHPATASITAYGIATKRVLACYLAAVVIHVVNNALVFSSALTNPFSIVVVGVAVAISFGLHRKTRQRIVK